MELYCRNGKRSYDKRTAVTAMNKRFAEDRQELRMYECEHGDHWHLTKQMRRERFMPLWKRNLRRKRTR